VLRDFGRTQVSYEPFDPAALNAGFAQLEEQARAELTAQGFADRDIELRRFAAMQYGWQVHQVEVPVPGGELTPPAMEQLIEDFEALYARLYGEGAGFRQAGVQIIDLRVDGVGLTPKPVLRGQLEERDSQDGPGTRDVFWPDDREWKPTSIYVGRGAGRRPAVRGSGHRRAGVHDRRDPPGPVRAGRPQRQHHHRHRCDAGGKGLMTTTEIAWDGVTNSYILPSSCGSRRR
jgi:hypothetical protein